MKLNQDKIPLDLGEAVQDVLRGLDAQDREEIKKIAYEAAHFSLGMFLRNNWSLWDRDTVLVQYFIKTYGLGHADDISSIIMDAVWSSVNELPANTKQIVDNCKKHWAKYKCNPINGEQIK